MEKKLVLCSTISFLREGYQNKHNLNISILISINKNIPELKRRIMYAMVCIGQSLVPLRTFCRMKHMRKSVTQNACDKICKHIINVLKTVVVESMKITAIGELFKGNQSNITVIGVGIWGMYPIWISAQ